jgi:hypothetical protein
MSDNMRQENIRPDAGGMVKNYAGFPKKGLISTVFEQNAR